MKPCLIIGSTVCDVIINLPEIPASAQDANIYGQTLQIGGCAFNVVSILHQLSLPYTFLSPVGIGVYGKFVESELQKVGITTTIQLNKKMVVVIAWLRIVEKERSFLTMVQSIHSKRNGRIRLIFLPMDISMLVE